MVAEISRRASGDWTVRIIRNGAFVSSSVHASRIKAESAAGEAGAVIV